MLAPSKQLYVKNLTSMDLLVHRCVCGELTILGFYGDLESVEKNEELKCVRYPAKCKKCGLVKWHYRQLVTGRAVRRRYVDWITVGFFLIKRIPKKWWRNDSFRGWLVNTILWLERRVRL